MVRLFLSFNIFLVCMFSFYYFLVRFGPFIYILVLLVPLIIINLWFVGFFDDSIRVRLVTLHYIKQKMPTRSIMALLVIGGTDLNGKHYNFFIISLDFLDFLVVNLWFVGFLDSIRVYIIRWFPLIIYGSLVPLII